MAYAGTGGAAGGVTTSGGGALVEGVGRGPGPGLLVTYSVNVRFRRL